MDFFDVANHLLNFAAPAALVALLVTYFSRFILPKRPAAHIFIAQAATNFIVCLGVLGSGLWLTGQDGKLATYLSMVLASATVPWVMAKGWRR